MASLRDRLRGVARREGQDPAEAEELPAEEARSTEETTELPALSRQPSARALRAEHHALQARYEALRDDLGGLLVEMGRQGRFNHRLLERRAGEAAALEARLLDFRRDADDDAAATGGAERAPRSCGRCGAVAAPDANFCAYCGATVIGG